ncbi:hypothetical protein G5714_022439 [Onychostoma macrolepis]|uniref:ALK and LTK ligand 2 n=2 Tax=Onychostoma macrolepis TaxID=369639 RepID=A0A7J6BN76_9TELE|nr:hypothetical protein G5714_022439 [Onychostoma macrolepis]
MSDVYMRNGQTVRRRLIRLRSAHLQHLSSTDTGRSRLNKTQRALNRLRLCRLRERNAATRETSDCEIQDLGSAGLARTLVAGAMRALRAPVLVMGLVMLICTTAQSEASVNKVEKTFRRIIDIMRLVENSADDASAQEKESAHHLKTETGETILKIFPRDVRKKEKVIRILTGPLYFSPKCRKHVYRLYHNTRDCTIPAYFKRCARLLTRLAGSPRCQEG